MKVTIKEDILIQSKDGTITGYYLKNGTVKINVGSFFKMHEANSLLSFSKEKRAYLLNNGYVRDGRLVKDCIFDSPSSAICALTGGMASGRSCFYTINNVELGEYLKSLSIVDITVKNCDLDIPEKKTSVREQFARNSVIAEDVLKKAYYKCEFDESHKTFIAKDGHLYMEAHHLIPLSKQDEFEKNLDVKENIICLCPTCHRLLHYGKDNKEKIEYLYSKRNKLLEQVGIRISIDKLYSYYEL